MRWINTKRCESVNTRASINRLLRGAGFRDISSKYDDRRIVFRAAKPFPTEPLVSREVYARGAGQDRTPEMQKAAKSSGDLDAERR